MQQLMSTLHEGLTILSKLYYTTPTHLSIFLLSLQNLICSFIYVVVACGGGAGMRVDICLVALINARVA